MVRRYAPVVLTHPPAQYAPEWGRDTGRERDRHWGYPWGFACLEGSSDLKEGPPHPTPLERERMSVLLALLEAAFLLRQLH